MWKRRIILAAVIVLTGTFASFCGGAARTLFYASLLVLPVCFLYTLYVYFRFRVYQSAETKVIVKGEKTPYYFALSDEDFVSYANVRVEFLDDFSVPQDTDFCHSYHLIPKEKVENRTKILCKYRGEYNIGVKRIIVTDFLGLMSIKYPAPSTIGMSVLPKITELEKISLSPLEDDAKLLRYSRGKSSEPPDCEMKKYAAGDSVKLINWRVSAKRRELFVRQSSDVPTGGVSLVMDMLQNQSDEYTRIITEDKILESALAIANYLVKRSTPLSIIYDQGGLNIDNISSPENLKEFCAKCASIKFRSEYYPDEICAAVPSLTMAGGGFTIFAVQQLSRELCEVCGRIISLGGDVAVILIGEEDKQIAEAMDRRIIYKHIALGDEISDILGGAC